MTERDLPENIKRALKESPAFAPSESFYRGVMEKVREPKPKPFFLRWQVHAAAGVCLVMLVVLAGREKQPLRMTQAPAALELKQVMEEEARPAPPRFEPKAVTRTRENEVSDKVSTILSDQRLDKNKAPLSVFMKDSGVKKEWRIQARDVNGPATQDSFGHLQSAANTSGASASVSEFDSGITSSRRIAAQTAKADTPDDVLPKAGLDMNWQGLSSGIGEPRQIVIRDAQAWAALWNEHQPGVPMPPVDFTRYMVVGVFLGARPNEGHELHIIDFKTLPDQIALEYQEFLPKEGVDYFQRLVQPYALKVIPKTDTYIHFHSLRPKDR